MGIAKTSPASRSIRRHALAGVAALVLVGGGAGGLAATTELSGAVVAAGFLVVESNVKNVQHPTGGIIGEILVRDGDTVSAGDVLVRLDDTLTRANLAIIEGQISELSARKARLEAERDGLDDVAFPEALATRAADAEVARILASEARLFALRRDARAGQARQLRERIAQARQEIAGLTTQAEAKVEEIALIERELEGVRGLYGKNLVPLSRVTALEREATRLDGERGQLVSSAAQVRGRIAETELQILQIEQDLRSEAAREIREIEARLAELSERRVAADDQLRRVEVRAPQSGTVHELSVHTRGGVVAPGDVLMRIVPASERLAVEVRVRPQDIDQLAPGQDAMLRFSAFSQRTTPELKGILARVSPDLVEEPRSGERHYVARVAFAEDEAGRLGDVALVPGMPVEAFVRTGDRTLLSYLTKPLGDYFTRAFREE
jgi:HlyD family secretion protein